MTKERVIGMARLDQDHFGLLSADKSVELWRVRGSEEIKKKIAEGKESEGEGKADGSS